MESHRWKWVQITSIPSYFINRTEKSWSLQSILKYNKKCYSMGRFRSAYGPDSGAATVTSRLSRGATNTPESFLNFIAFFCGKFLNACLKMAMSLAKHFSAFNFLRLDSHPPTFGLERLKTGN